MQTVRDCESGIIPQGTTHLRFCPFIPFNSPSPKTVP